MRFKLWQLTFSPGTQNFSTDCKGLEFGEISMLSVSLVAAGMTNLIISAFACLQKLCILHFLMKAFFSTSATKGFSQGGIQCPLADGAELAQVKYTAPRIK